MQASGNCMRNCQAIAESTAGVEGAGGSGGHGRASRCGAWLRRSRAAGPGGHSQLQASPDWRPPRSLRARLRCPRAAAGPGRTTSRRAERSSLRGRLAGEPPPTAQHGPAGFADGWALRHPEHHGATSDPSQSSGNWHMKPVLPLQAAITRNLKPQTPLLAPEQ